MPRDAAPPFLHRAGLWASRATPALVFTLVFAAVVFLPCFFLVDRHPRRGLVRLLRVLAIVCVVLVPVLIAWVVQSGVWDRGVVMGAMMAVLLLAGCAVGFWRAAQHGAEVATLRPQGDPRAHWSRLLREHPRWWIRSRAARELGGMAERDGPARDALLAAQHQEGNRHVRAAIRHGLQRAQGRPTTPASP